MTTLRQTIVCIWVMALLSACVAGVAYKRGRVIRPPPGVVLVLLGDQGPEHVGVCETWQSGGRVVYVDPGLDPRFRRVVVAHEFGHAIGIDHTRDTSCYMAHGGGNWDLGPPCSWEAERARAYAGPELLVRVLSPSLLGDVVFACDVWNAAAGRTVLVVSTTP